MTCEACCFVLSDALGLVPIVEQPANNTFLTLPRWQWVILFLRSQLRELLNNKLDMGNYRAPTLKPSRPYLIRNV